ncbi:MAG TPA: DUF1801 domain-containing protein [Gemmatimonadaceae bacterium]|nr:DUF1801 domain-containing protein [Gemmatimonadaceae bacterium]
MSENRTKPTDESVDAFLSAVPDEERRADCRRVLDIMREITGKEPRLWGRGMIGFDSYHYRYGSGREGDWFITGFSPRKNDLTIYIMAGFDRYEELMGRLGKHRTGKSCLYLKRLADVDPELLKELIAESVRHMRATHDTGATRS